MNSEHISNAKRKELIYMFNRIINFIIRHANAKKNELQHKKEVERMGENFRYLTEQFEETVAELRKQLNIK